MLNTSVNILLVHHCSLSTNSHCQMLKTYYHRFIHAKYKCKCTFSTPLFPLYQLTLSNVRHTITDLSMLNTSVNILLVHHCSLSTNSHCQMLKTYYHRFIHAKYKCKYTFSTPLFPLYQLTLSNVKDILSQIYPC